MSLPQKRKQKNKTVKKVSGQKKAQWPSCVALSGDAECVWCVVCAVYFSVFVCACAVRKETQKKKHNRNEQIKSANPCKTKTVVFSYFSCRTVRGQFPGFNMLLLLGLAEHPCDRLEPKEVAVLVIAELPFCNVRDRGFRLYCFTEINHPDASIPSKVVDKQ